MSQTTLHRSRLIGELSNASGALIANQANLILSESLINDQRSEGASIYNSVGDLSLIESFLEHQSPYGVYLESGKLLVDQARIEDLHSVSDDQDQDHLLSTSLYVSEMSEVELTAEAENRLSLQGTIVEGAMGGVLDDVLVCFTEQVAY